MQRTRQLLRQALLSLVREKGFESVTVQDVLDRANIGRATFYAHFDDKEDLLLSGLEELRASLKALQRESLGRDGSAGERLLGFSRELFDHARGHRDLFRAMAGDRSDVVVRRALYRMVVELVREDVRTIASGGAADSERVEAAVQFAAGGLFGLLMWWMEGRAGLSVDQIDAIFRRLAIPALKATVPSPRRAG